MLVLVESRGYPHFIIRNSYSTGVVDGTADVGGLAGYVKYAEISDSYSACDVYGIEHSIGGLAGAAWDSSIRDSYSTGNVFGETEDTQWIGGLIGQIISSDIEQSYAAGNVTGCTLVGGLAGSLEDGARIIDSYALGSVGGNHKIGGLVGGLFSDDSDPTEVLRSYAAGEVSSFEDDSHYIGGFIGDLDVQEAVLEDNFFDTEATNQAYGTGALSGSDPDEHENVTGLSTEEMQIQQTFEDAGWDFNNVWAIVEEETYPYLKWQPDPTSSSDPGSDSPSDTDSGSGGGCFIQSINP